MMDIKLLKMIFSYFVPFEIEDFLFEIEIFQLETLTGSLSRTLQISALLSPFVLTFGESLHTG